MPCTDSGSCHGKTSPDEDEALGKLENLQQILEEKLGKSRSSTIMAME